MKHTLTLHYSIQNGGDGSAYPKFMSSAKLAEYDQENMAEGWGESCTGCITLESDSPITANREITTPESYFAQLIDDEGEVEKFIEAFFPQGRPEFKVELEEVKGSKHDYVYIYNKIFVDGVCVGKIFRNKKESGKVFEDLLNEERV